MRHIIYLPKEDSQPGTQRAVREALRIADWVTPYVRRNGDDLVIWRVRPADLSNARVLAAFKARGVESLPALIAGSTVLVGCSSIAAYYKGVMSGKHDELAGEPFAARGGVAPRNRGRPFMGRQPSSAAEEKFSATGELGDENGEDIVAEFYGNEAYAFRNGGAAEDYQFGSALSRGADESSA